MISHTIEHDMYLRYCASPNPEGTIVYIHGLGESGLCFEDIIIHPKLRHWCHLVPDLCGYGKSLWQKMPMRLEDHANHLVEWLKKRNTSQVVILGHSMGGVIGLMLCEKHPEIAQAFVNVEGNISLEDCSFSEKAASYSLKQLLDQGLQNIFDTIYHDGLDNHALRTYYASLRMCDPRVYYLNSKELVELSANNNLANRQGVLTFPNIYILGNPRGTGAYSRRLLSAANVEWQAVENAGHWPFVDQNDRFAEEMLSFLHKL